MFVSLYSKHPVTMHFYPATLFVHSTLSHIYLGLHGQSYRFVIAIKYGPKCHTFTEQKVKKIKGGGQLIVF